MTNIVTFKKLADEISPTAKARHWVYENCKDGDRVSSKTLVEKAGISGAVASSVVATLNGIGALRPLGKLAHGLVVYEIVDLKAMEGIRDRQPQSFSAKHGAPGRRCPKQTLPRIKEERSIVEAPSAFVATRPLHEELFDLAVVAERNGDDVEIYGELIKIVAAGFRKLSRS